MSDIAHLRDGQKSLSENEELEAIKVAIIYKEQRIPTYEEQQAYPRDTVRLGPLFSVFESHLKKKTSESAFQLWQELWTYLAGDWSRYWGPKYGKQAQPDELPYAPLDRTKREIRVLQISDTSLTEGDTQSGASGNKTFKANLLRVSLDDHPPYIAISYTWGDPSIVGRFQSDQSDTVEFQYTQALFDIVNTLVPRGSRLYLWIDSLCINQHDTTEKGHQVGLMNDIYRNAQQVVVYLGEADDQTALEMDLFHRMGPVAKSDYDIAFLTEDEQSRVALESTEAGIPLGGWSSAGALLSRRWFTRYWVIQEVALGKHPVVVCGRHAVSWDLFTSAYDWMLRNLVAIMHLELREEMPNTVDFAQQPWILYIIIKTTRQQVQSDRPLFLADMINRCAVFQATDPRDRIFALMGLASQPETEESIQPNYEISVEELYTDVTRRFLKGERGVNTLYMAGIGSRRSSLRLPSWVPDWTTAGHPDNPQSRLNLLHNIEGDTELLADFTPEYPDLAVLHGRVVDSVSRLSLVHPTYPDNHSQGNQWCDSVLGLVKEGQPEAQISTGEPAAAGPGPSWKRYFGRTLAADRKLEAGPEGDAQLERLCDNYMTLLRHTEDITSMSNEDEETFRSTRDATTRVEKRRVFISSKGYFGLTSPGSQEGDLVCIFAGMKSPILIRPVRAEDMHPLSTPTNYALVGEVYHDGIAHEELHVDTHLMEPIRLV